MRLLRSLPLCVLASALLCGTAAMAQNSAPAVRIVNPIDESQLVTLKGNTHPAANARNDRGPVSPNLPMTDLILVLSRSPEQQAAFDKFVASQYEPGSPDFHHWLEPAEVGANFGPSETDIATISNWLTRHGFTIDEVSGDRMTIRFSGTAAQVESAFHTEIHNLEVKGVAHIGNMSDPRIPTALTPVVVGVKALHNFFPRPQHRMGSNVTLNRKTGRWERVASDASTGAKTSAAATPQAVRPQFGTQDSIGDVIEDVVPYDFAKIYNVLPLWNASTPINGTGQTIAIAGTSDILPADVAAFRSAFGLPAVNSFTTIVANGTDPGQCGVNPTTYCTLDDQMENSLDVEWSGAVAPGAGLVLVVSGANSTTTDTVYSSANYIIQHKATVNASILNVSYSECELGMGTSGNVAYYDMWQTAASEGIAAFVSSGDSGSASCDAGGDANGTPYAAEYGLTVSGLASTPYDTAVGGTDFNWCPASTITSNTACTASPYWGASNNATTQANALGYVPEIPWNDSCASPTGIAVAQYFAQQLSGAGYPTPAPIDAETSCNFYVENYLLFYELSGGGDISYFVDTVGGSGGASGCVVNDGQNVSSCVSTTTTTGTANGSIHLVNDGWPKPSWQTNANIPGLPSDGVRDIPDVSFFASNGFNNSAYLICVSAAGSCTYTGDSDESPLDMQEVGGTSVSSPAMAGVMALINQKAGTAQGSPNTELYALAAKQTYSSCSAESVTASSACYFNDIDEYTNAQPCDFGYFGNKSPNCTATESYDGSADGVGVLSSGIAGEGGYNAVRGFDMATGLGSLNVANVVNAWTPLIGTATAKVTVSPAQGSITVNQSLSVTVTVASVPAGGTTPTGTVTLSSGSYSSGAQTLNTSGSYTFTIPAGSLSTGSDTLTANYSGDFAYAQATGTANVTVTRLTPTMTVNPSATSIFTNQSLTVTGTVTGNGTTTPTGTVTLTGGGLNPALTGTLLSSGNYSITIPVDSLSAGNDTLTVTYSGDAIYASAANTTIVKVTTYVPLIPSVTVTPAANSVDSGSSLNVTGTVTGSGTTPTGTVTLSGGGYTSAAATLSSGNYSITIPANSLSAGSDTLTVSYSGDIIYATATGTASVTVTQSVYTVVAAAASPASIAPGATATSTVTVSSTTGYTGTVTLSCALTTSPSGATDLPTCSGINTSQSVGGTGATFTVYTTAASSSALTWPKLGNGKGWAGAGGGAVLAFLVFLGIPARRRSWRSMLGVLVVMAALGSLASCGGGGGGGGGQSNPGTTAGNYTFTVTGTGNPAVTPAPTSTFTVTVN